MTEAKFEVGDRVVWVREDREGLMFDSGVLRAGDTGTVVEPPMYGQDGDIEVVCVAWDDIDGDDAAIYVGTDDIALEHEAWLRRQLGTLSEEGRRLE